MIGLIEFSQISRLPAKCGPRVFGGERSPYSLIGQGYLFLQGFGMKGEIACFR